MMNQKEKFADYLKNYTNLIYKVSSMYCHNTEDRKDLVQDITLQLWRSFPNYNPKFALSTWTYRIALNVSISHYRKVTHQHKGLENYKETIPTTSDDNTESEEKLNTIYSAFKILKPIDKAIIGLHLEGCSNQEIGEVTGLTATNVGTRLNRIKTKLKDYLKHKS